MKRSALILTVAVLIAVSASGCAVNAEKGNGALLTFTTSTTVEFMKSAGNISYGWDEPAHLIAAREPHSPMKEKAPDKMVAINIPTTTHVASNDEE